MTSPASINDRIYQSYAQNISSSNDNGWVQKVSLGDTAVSDAFSRLRVSNPQVIFDNHETSGSKPLVWSTEVAGGASITYHANESSHHFVMGTASGDKATRSSKKLANYVPGTSLMILNTGVMGAGYDNSRQRIGLFNEQNGLFFEQRDGVIGVSVRTYVTGSAVETHITQADWNIDKMDGTTGSGIDLDLTKTQIFLIDLQWLGVGRVRYGFDIDGKIHYCHEILNANNVLDTVYMTTPLLPVTFEEENTGTSTARQEFHQICSSVIAEGGIATDALPRSINNGITSVATSTTIEPILSIRLKAAFAGKGNIRLTNVSPISTGNKQHLFQLWLNPTLTAASFSDVDGIAQKDVAATAITGGTLIGSFYASASDVAPLAAFNSQLVLGTEIDGTVDILTLSAQTLSASDAVVASFDYEEIF